MKTVAANADHPSTIAKLEEIQREMRDMCEPHYDEFHKTVADHGFIKITIPRPRRRA